MASNMNLDELIARPLDAIARLGVELEAQQQPASENTATTGGHKEEGALLAAAISTALRSGDSPALNKVPILCRDSLAEGKLPPNSLVRYRGMVQDQYEPEYFVGSFDEVEAATGKRSRVDVKYVDNIVQRPGFVNEYDGAGAKTMDRLPLFCVPVPGLSQWASPSNPPKERDSNKMENGGSTAMSGLLKRQRGAGDDAMDCTDEGSDSASKNQPELDPSGPQQKNQRNSDSVSSEGGVTNGSAASAAITQGGGSISVAAAAAIAGGGGAVAFHHGQELELAGLACVVKMYDFREGGVKLNDTVEFVGVLGYDQPISPQEEDSLMGEEAEQVPSSPFQGLEDFSRKVPPPSLAPRLHCIFHRVVPACDPLLVDPKQPNDALHALQGPLPFGDFMRGTKRQAIAHLAEALGGDALAAEFTLLALLSRAYARTESLAPGSFSLNLRGLSAGDAPPFSAAVAALVPKCVTVPITTKSLSEEFKFSPKKDYEADRLMLSSLQLSEGTVVVLDETKLEPGQVGKEGIGNLSALKSLVSLQKIPYDFGFYKMDFEVDHPTIALSVRGSVVPAGATVPVIKCGVTATVPGEKAALMARLRVYVEATRRMDLSLDETSSALAEEDFVKARQQGQSITAEDFHRMLTIARLTALANGDIEMNSSHWSHMKAIEAQVAERVRQATTTTDGVDAPAWPVSPVNSQAGPLNAIPEDD